MTADASVTDPVRGAVLSRTALIGGVAVAVALGVGTFSYLAELDPVSTSPFEGTGGWFALVVVGLLGAAFAVLLAVVAVLVSRPRTTAVVALAACLLLPVVALTAGSLAGLEVLRLHTTADLAGGGTAALQSFGGVLHSWGVDPQPLIDYLRR